MWGLIGYFELQAMEEQVAPAPHHATARAPRPPPARSATSARTARHAQLLAMLAVVHKHWP
eukprot:5270607-Prymnesium_polylepis.1